MSIRLKLSSVSVSELSDSWFSMVSRRALTIDSSVLVELSVVLVPDVDEVLELTDVLVVLVVDSVLDALVDEEDSSSFFNASIKACTIDSSVLVELPEVLDVLDVLPALDVDEPSPPAAGGGGGGGVMPAASSLSLRLPLPSASRLE